MAIARAMSSAPCWERPSSLSTSGNRIRRAHGGVWAGRGVNLQDTRSCSACEDSEESLLQVKRRIDELVGGWHVDFIRLTLQSDTLSQTVLSDPTYLAHVQ